LDNIISIGVPDELLGVRDDLGDKRLLLLRCGSIDAFLHDTASVLVTRDFLALPNHFFKDEVLEGSFKGGEGLLDDVVAINILYERPNMGFKDVDHQGSELVC
jgi:hypothetical protein